jgi:hypothetical protein
MPNDRLRQQFEQSKQRFKELGAGRSTSKPRWQHRLRAAAATAVFFVFGAGFEAGTKLFKDSIPPRLNETLCYASDFIRYNKYPYQFTIVILPLRNDRDDDVRRKVAALFLEAGYDVQTILPCGTVELGSRGGKARNQKDYIRDLAAIFSKYNNDLLITGAINDNLPQLIVLLSEDLKAEHSYEQQAHLSESTSVSLNVQEVDSFLRKHVERSISSTLEAIRYRCALRAVRSGCEYPGTKVPDSMIHLISKLDMFFQTTYDSDTWKQDNPYAGGCERDECDEQKQYLAAWAAARSESPMVKTSASTLPILSDMVHRYGKTTYVDANGRDRSLFELSEKIIHETEQANQGNRELSYVSGLIYQSHGEVCMSPKELKISITRFSNAFDQNADAEALLALGRSQALLYAWGDEKDKGDVEKGLPETLTKLDNLQIHSKDSAALRFMRIVNERIATGSKDVLAGLQIADRTLCPS